jgi:hypothetical protein
MSVGSYFAEYNQSGLAVGENSGTWGTGIELTPISVIDNYGFGDVSCAPDGSCSAVGLAVSNEATENAFVESLVDQNVLGVGNDASTPANGTTDSTAERPRIIIDSTTVSLKTKSNKFLVRLACTSSRCTGSVQMTDTVRVRRDVRVHVGKKIVKKMQTLTRTLVLAQAKYSAAAASSIKVDLRLTANGRRVLATIHTKPLRKQIAVTVLGGARATRTVRVIGNS